MITQICQHWEVVQTGVVFQTTLATYVDPGSGSYYFQMLIAGLTTFCFFFSSIKRKIASHFKKSAPAPVARETVSVKPKDKLVAK
jgi:hypothetical protein